MFVVKRFIWDEHCSATATARGIIRVLQTHFLSSPLAGKLDIVVTIFVQCMCVRASVGICLDHNLYNNAWILKHFGTVVALVEEKWHLKHF